jgi:hypothetical protein
LLEVVMQHPRRRVILAVAAAAACIAGCSSAEGAGPTDNAPPARVQAGAGGGQDQLVLTEVAARRLGLTTRPVSGTTAARGTSRTATGATSVPFGALLYDAEGRTWVYTSPAPLTYVRQRVDVLRVVGDTVVLRDGPPAGTQIVTVGAPELLGTELGVGGE